MLLKANNLSEYKKINSVTQRVTSLAITIVKPRLLYCNGEKLLPDQVSYNERVLKRKYATNAILAAIIELHSTRNPIEVNNTIQGYWVFFLLLLYTLLINQMY